MFSLHLIYISVVHDALTDFLQTKCMLLDSLCESDFPSAWLQATEMTVSSAEQGVEKAAASHGRELQISNFRLCFSAHAHVIFSSAVPGFKQGFATETAR